MSDEAQVSIRSRKRKDGKNVYDLRWMDPITGEKKSRAIRLHGKPCTDIVAAKAEARILQDKITNGHYRAIRKVAWSTFCDEHVRLIPGERYAEGAQRVLSEFGKVVGKIPTAVTFADIERYVDWLRVPKERDGPGNRPATIRSKLLVLSAAFNQGVKRGYLTDTPMKNWRWAKLEDKTIRTATDEEERAVIQAAEDLFGLQGMCFVRAALDTGARRGELLALGWDRVECEGEKPQVTFVKTKGKKARRIPLADCPELVDMLRRLYLQTQQDGGPFVLLNDQIGISRMWLKICKAAGVTGLTLHDLRRTFVTRLIRSGVSLPTVQKLAGHSSINTTLRFYNAVDDTDLIEGMAKMRKFVDAG